MKPSALRIERLLAKVEATLVPPPRKRLQVIVHEGGDEAETEKRTLEAQEKALAEHQGPRQNHQGHGGRLDR
jgi:hypothetical protein